MTHILYSFNILGVSRSETLTSTADSFASRVTACFSHQPPKKDKQDVWWQAGLGPKYSFLVKDLIGSRVALLMGCRSKHQLSESSFSGPCCCRAPDADDD